MALRFSYNVTVAAADADGVATSQTRASAGDLALVAPVVETGNRMVSLTSTDDLSALTFTVYGEAPGGGPMSVSVAGPSNNTVPVGFFASVNRVTVSGDMALATVEVGWIAEASTPPWPCDVRANPFSIGFGCVIKDGTPTFTVQHTYSKVFATGPTGAPGINQGDWTWFPHPSVANENANMDGTYSAPLSAIRMVVTGEGEVSFEGYQADGHN